MTAGLFPFWLRGVILSSVRGHWRRDVLAMGLVVMEGCTVFPWHGLLLGSGGLRMRIPLLVMVVTMLFAFYCTRGLHGGRVNVLLQGVITVAGAAAGALLLVWALVYRGCSVVDCTWLGRFGYDIVGLMGGIRPSLVVFLSGLFLWWRGVVLAQGELDVQRVGLAFRAGIVSFLWISLVSMVVWAPQLYQVPLLYFSASLATLGVAQAEDSMRSRFSLHSPFAASWVGVIVVVVAAFALFGSVATGLLSLRSFAALGNVLRPIGALIRPLLEPLGAAVAGLLELLLTWLIRAFSSLFPSGGEGLLPAEGLGGMWEPSETASVATRWATVLRLAGSLLPWLCLVFVLLLIAVEAIRLRRESQEATQVSRAEAWGHERVESPSDALTRGLRSLLDEMRARLASFRDGEYSLESIRRTYASLVRLASSYGYPRQCAETPYEYMDTLNVAFPDSTEEISLITEAYVRTRYGERVFSQHYVNSVGQAWLRLHDRAQVELAEQGG